MSDYTYATCPWCGHPNVHVSEQTFERHFDVDAHLPCLGSGKQVPAEMTRGGTIVRRGDRYWDEVREWNSLIENGWGLPPQED